ncbi:MAG: hypothetical protein LPD71_14760, partial [Shewanella sp.]|nr:hypothetical protein [Shewanella sp.]
MNSKQVLNVFSRYSSGCLQQRLLTLIKRIDNLTGEADASPILSSPIPGIAVSLIKHQSSPIPRGFPVDIGMS